MDTAPKKLPVDPSLEHLRKQAKQLLRAHQRGLAPAKQRVERVFTGKSLKLADTQHVLAVEFGFPSWPKLAAHVESVTGPTSRARELKLPEFVKAGDFEGLRAKVEAGDFIQHELDHAWARACADNDPGPAWVRREMAAYLYNHGADPDGEYGGNYGPLLLGACEGAEADTIERMLVFGADPNTDPDRVTKYPAHNTPMRMLLNSYIRGYVDQKHQAIQLLMDHGATVPREIDNAAFAVFRDDDKTLGILLASESKRISRRLTGFRYGNVPLEGATLLHQAVEFESPSCVDLLCSRGYEHGIHINVPATPFVHPETGEKLGGQTPVFHAIASNGGGNFPMFEHLLDKYGRWIDFSVRATIRTYCWSTNNDPTLVDVTPLQMAEAGNDPEDANPYWKSRDQELAILRERDARSAMENAVKRGEEAAAIALMDRHPEHIGPHLWAAATHDARSLPLVQELLRRGLDPNATADPRSALDLACYFGDTAMIRVLVEAGADPKRVNPLGERPADLLGRYEPIDDATLAACRAALDGLPS
ncbi:MAG: hypothetical protein AAF916_00685 [Planctomycetota bacterium]